MTEPAGNPLKDVNLSEVFTKDPEDLKEPDIETIVTALRARRATFKVAEKTGKQKFSSGQVKLEDLDLGLT